MAVVLYRRLPLFCFVSFSNYSAIFTGVNCCWNGIGAQEEGELDYYYVSQHALGLRLSRKAIIAHFSASSLVRT